MAHSSRIGTSRGYLAHARAQEPAALHHLRQRRRRQVDADRPAALRVEADLRGPARRARGATRARRHAGGGDIDFALLVDGLEAEREQGITIDVAYRYFSTDQRKFIVADTPGPRAVHAQHGHRRLDRRLAVILIDARKGVLTQTRRHSWRSLLGIRHVVLAVNKMDLVDFAEEAFERDRARLREVRGADRLRGRRCDPDLGARGRQRRRRQRACPGTTGRRCSSTSRRRGRPRAHGVRAVPHAGAVGQPAEPGLPRLRRHDRSGGVVRRPGDAPPSPRDAHGRAHRHLDGDLDEAVAGQSVTLTLADEIDVSRGDVIAAAAAAAGVADQFEATVVWMARRADAAGRTVLDEDRHAADRHRDGRAAQAQARRQHARAPRGRRRSSSTRSACAPRARPPVVVRALRARTARPARSS